MCYQIQKTYNRNVMNVLIRYANIGVDRKIRQLRNVFDHYENILKGMLHIYLLKGWVTET